MLLGHLPACKGMQPRSHTGSKSQMAEKMVPMWESFITRVPFLDWEEEKRRSGGLFTKGLFFPFLLHWDCSDCQTAACCPVPDPGVLPAKTTVYHLSAQLSKCYQCISMSALGTGELFTCKCLRYLYLDSSLPWGASQP